MFHQESEYLCPQTLEMGRKKNSKLSLSKRNKKNVSARWNRPTTNSSLSEKVGLGVSEVITSCETDPDLSVDNSDSNNEPVEKKTGFALYNSYGEKIPTDDNAIKYMLVDLSPRGAFTRGLSLKTFPLVPMSKQ